MKYKQIRDQGQRQEQPVNLNNSTNDRNYLARGNLSLFICRTIRMTRIVFAFLFLLLGGCSQDLPETPQSAGCAHCHAMQLDSNHRLACSACHHGNDKTTDKALAHQGLIAQPAHPDNMQESCGSCHEQIVAELQHATHFTLQKLTNDFRQAFGATEKLDNFRQTPAPDDITTELDLADDLLRRRCLRCHLYSRGDDYPAVSHGTGCAACHLAYRNGELLIHKFGKPGDNQCLSCHYGNYVGFDYYGRFEHDYHKEYRTPFTVSGSKERPYGVEFHPLLADIHQQRGMQCIDCHSGEEIMAQGHRLLCADCHKQDHLKDDALPPRITRQDQAYILLDARGKTHPVPIMHHPLHARYADSVSCQVCHAQWAFADGTVHFLRQDSDEYDRWEPYIVQGDSELEALLRNNTDFEKDELPNEMTDKINGEAFAGIWLKGYTERRWETVVLGRDEKGIIVPMRRLLDYRLSWVDEDEEVRFDSVPSHASSRGFRPYVPHTTGPAGPFCENRITAFLMGGDLQGTLRQQPE
jgi:hypothetical protein